MLESQGWRSRALPELVAAELADLPEKAVIHAKKLISTMEKTFQNMGSLDNQEEVQELARKYR